MIAFIGKKGLWSIIKPLGVTIYEVETENDLLETLKEIENENYDLVFMSEDLLTITKIDIEKYYKEQGLNIILFPAPTEELEDEKQSVSYKRLRKIVEKAMGVDILQ